MPLYINGTNIPNTGNVNFNGTSLTKVIFNNVTVWEKQTRKYLVQNGSIVDTATDKYLNDSHTTSYRSNNVVYVEGDYYDDDGYSSGRIVYFGPISKGSNTKLHFDFKISWVKNFTFWQRTTGYVIIGYATSILSDSNKYLLKPAWGQDFISSVLSAGRSYGYSGSNVAVNTSSVSNSSATYSYDFTSLPSGNFYPAVWVGCGDYAEEGIMITTTINNIYLAP